MDIHHSGNSLSADQIAEFHANGCIGPFRLHCSDEELGTVRELARNAYLSPNPIYEQIIGRDLHLYLKPVHDLFTRPEIREKTIQLLGPDLTVWRSDVFPKFPGSPATPWHQADVFTEFTEDPLLESPHCGKNDWSRLWQVTVWIALEDSTIQNGCLEIIPGTHHEQITWPIVGEEAKAYLAETIARGEIPNPDRCIKHSPKVKLLEPQHVKLEAKAGEFYIFTQRVVHGSGANNTAHSRLAINFRVIQSDVRCYRHYLDAGEWEMLGLKLPLKNWGALIYAGAPPDPAVNRVITPPAA